MRNHVLVVVVATSVTFACDSSPDARPRRALVPRSLRDGAAAHSLEITRPAWSPPAGLRRVEPPAPDAYAEFCDRVDACGDETVTTAAECAASFRGCALGLADDARQELEYDVYDCIAQDACADLVSCYWRLPYCRSSGALPMIPREARATPRGAGALERAHCASSPSSRMR